ncbi:hypothetical protein CB0940_07061 [Cercospora beticola]|uniref:Uncharacterized protein n=2 Tax=Cercospora beticola TaxID=122368 RepID=A0A2G5H9N3_CERBT|nr:hypothetical protein CB0940_07061 [Cercospora beticola]PIA89246.1 hypothetical protein CB0940_07061 [Cercospora beticola]CAK1358314.1 unnamed protein product [Cercospora beticola]
MRRMALARDEEIGKRDDDFFRPRRSHSPPATMAATFPLRWRRRRVMVVLGVLFLVYIVHLYVPGGLGAGYQTESFHPKPARTFAGYDTAKSREPKGAPPRDVDSVEDEQSQHYYNGVTRFYRLGGSLQKVSKAMGSYHHNRNVLFAAASMKSLANLVPMACEMAGKERNEVQFAVFGRSPLPLDDIQELNGIDGSCTIQWHDARGDYAEYSSDSRVESAVRGAMKHIQEYMHPQVVIMDDGAQEEAYFTKAMHAKTKDLGIPLVEIPRGKYEEWLWLTRLSAASLAQWWKPTIDIVIQAPRESSGRLIRLLQSLYNADYRGLKVPRISIELPPEVEPALQKYLNTFSWPPGRDSSLQPNLLTVHHRIPSELMSPQQASLRYVESFYPAQTNDHHVLLVSPQVEVSSVYYQYLQYALLNYRYAGSTFTALEELGGISLDVPLQCLNGSTGFQQPKVSDMGADKITGPVKADDDDPAPFLYQAPTSKATLVFGDKWATFHNFLTNRLEASHSGKAKKNAKLVAETEPAWAEYLLELMRARNLYVLHPPTTFAAIHNELAQIPEEYLRTGADSHKAASSEPEHIDDSFILSAEQPVLTEHDEAEPERNQMPLHKTLPFQGELPGVYQLPFVGYNGEVATSYALSELSEEYVQNFRKTIGGCMGDSITRAREIEPLRTDDLFCLPGQAIMYAEQTVPHFDPYEEDEESALNIAEESDADEEDELEPAKVGADAASKQPKLIIPSSTAGTKGEALDAS